MVLSTEWSQVEVIDLVNDGNGLGFILVGGRSTGVVIKALTPGGVAERDGRLQCGDHLLQIGEVNLRGYGSEQVATVLRQTGAQVRLIVARPVESGANDLQLLASHAPIIPTKLLSDPEELSRHLFHNPSFATSAANVGGVSVSVSGIDIDFDMGMEMGLGLGGGLGIDIGRSGCSLPTPDTELADLPLPPIPTELHSATAARACPKDLDIIPFSIVSPSPLPQLLPKRSIGTPHTPSAGIDDDVNKLNVDHIETVIAGNLVVSNQTTTTRAAFINESDRCSVTSSNSAYMDSPETETYEVELHKNVYGLGITVAGYVCEEEDLSGIFVKSIIEGSAAESSGQIQINDRIVAVDGRSLAGVTNHQAVDILRNTDIEVHLTLERFLRGRKYEHLQVALTELKGGVDTQSQYSVPGSPSIATLSWLPPKSDADSIATDGDGILIMEFNDIPSRDTVESNLSTMLDRSDHSCSSSVNGKHQKTPTTPQASNSLANGRAPHINGNGLADSGTDEADECINVQRQMESKLCKSSSKTPTLENVQLEKSVSTAAATVRVMTMTTKKSTVTAPTQNQTHTQNQTQTQTQKIENNKISITSPSGESLKVAWKSEFPESEIIVAEINKLSGLGISLEGTVDVECGIEKRPHHYIRSILEDGPVGRQGILKPGDELLQVNDVKLQGLKHIEVVKILKELPSHVKLVCARGPKAPSVINTSQNPEAFETRSLLPGGVQSLQNLMTKALSESSLYTSSTATLTDQQRSKSLENVSGLALWSSDITEVEIEKTEHGFGFSILDYQDPMDPEGSVIVIRGLIRGGSAEATNDIFPGDRLVSVGPHSLQGLELDEAVAILKGMPLGITKLGICRPLSTSDSNIASPIGEGDSPST